MTKQEQIEKDFSEFLKGRHNRVIHVVFETLNEWMDKPYYEWVARYDFYDRSGDLDVTTFSNKEKVTTVEELLDCYTGQRTPSYESGYGWYFDRVEKEVNWKIDNLVFGELLKEFCVNQQPPYNDPEYMNFEDIVGDCNIDVQIFIEDFLKNTSLDDLKTPM